MKAEFRHRVLQANAETETYASGPALEVVPASDRLVEEGYTQLLKRGRFHSAGGFAHTCCVCLKPVKQAGAGPASETCPTGPCRTEYRKAVKCLAALQEEWHRERVRYRLQLEREGRA